MNIKQTHRKNTLNKQNNNNMKYKINEILRVARSKL